jgi:hypothetical protein
MAASDSLPARHPLPGSSPVIGRDAPTIVPQTTGPGRASPVPAATIRTFRALYAGESLEAASRIFTSSVAFAVTDAARLSLSPARGRAH